MIDQLRKIREVADVKVEQIRGKSPRNSPSTSVGTETPAYEHPQPTTLAAGRRGHCGGPARPRPPGIHAAHGQLEGALGEIATLQKDIAGGRGAIERAQRTQSLWADMQANALAKDTGPGRAGRAVGLRKMACLQHVELSSMKQQWKRGANDSYSVLECRVDATGSLAALTAFFMRWKNRRSPCASTRWS